MPSPLAVSIRRARRADVVHIAGMIQELADFEEMPSANKATHEKLLATINFADDTPSTSETSASPSRKVAYCLLAIPDIDKATAEAEAPVGMALFFYNYSTWLATPGVYLEDLYVRPVARRRGVATRLFGALGRETRAVADETGDARLEWSCLRWNEGALKFYERIGGVRMEDWVGIRVEGKMKLEQLEKLAS